MLRNVSIILLLAIIVALPFVFRKPPPQGDWREGDPVIVIVSPHNEAIRYEFAQAFSRWHKEKYGKPVKIDWRNIGGTSEISRYLTGQYTDNTRAWWRNQGKQWPTQATEDLTKSSPNPATEEVYKAYRETDSPDAITSGIDLFFGGGEFDHSAAFKAGFAVPVIDLLPPELFKQDGIVMIPEKVSGETWRTPSVMGNVVSTFGIIYNVDRLNDLGITTPPTQWTDLADYRYFGQVGLADPTKSGSIAKAFEMIVHQQMHDAAVEYILRSSAKLWTPDAIDAQIATNEKRIGDYIKEQGKTYQRGDVPDDLKEYQAALERGFANGLHLIQKIGANARYFTDSASKVPIDVSMGDAAVGMAIDFYGRYQAEASRGPDGSERMKFVTPVGGTSVSCDPISLLRGAGGHVTASDQKIREQKQKETREAAIHFIEFVLSEEGQRLWCYKPGTTNAEGELIGPEKYALRRLPIRRTFYPSTQPAVQAKHLEHLSHSVDNLADPMIDPYQVSEQFVYYRRWTGEHFSVLRDIVRAMCLDSGDELKAAWKTIHMRADYPEYDPPLGPLPTVTLSPKQQDGSVTTEEVPLNWRTAPEMSKTYERIEYMREWTRAFRDTYRRIRSGELKGNANGVLG